MNSKVGMMALLEGTEKMAALDWRVAPVPWRNHFSNPGRPLKVSGTEDKREKKYRKFRLDSTPKTESFLPLPECQGQSGKLWTCSRRRDMRSQKTPLLIICFDPLAGGRVDATMPGSYLQCVA